MGADARPKALLALAPLAVMLAYLRSAAVLALALLAVVQASLVWHGGSCWLTWVAVLASFELALIEPWRVVELVGLVIFRALTTGV